MIEEHKKLLLPTIIRGVLYGLIVTVLLVNVPSLFGIRLSSEVYAEKITKMNEMETKRSNDRFYEYQRVEDACEL